MTDLFDYIIFYLITLFLAVCKFAGFLDISWIWVLSPTLFAFFIYVVSMFMRD